MVSCRLLNKLDLYWDKINKVNISTLNLEDLFLMRVAAFRYIADMDPAKRKQARQFLIDTMTQSESEYSFPNKENFVKTTENWEYPQIIAQRSDDIHAILYKINYYQKGVQHTLHELSFFEKSRDNQYKFTHKYDLTALSKRYFRATQEVLIRQIGDPVLHQEALEVTDFSEVGQSQMDVQARILTSVLVKTGGVGIAANQCLQVENPLKIIIAGVDYNNPEHVAKAIARYPTTLFPQMKTYINPVILNLSKEQEAFAEGCLSVQGVFRASVLRPSKLTIGYQDGSGSQQIKILSGSDARVMLHEVDHILNGKVYIQRIIEELSVEQLNLFLKVLDFILSRIKENKVESSFSSPMIVFKRDDNNALIFEENELQDALIKLPDNVISGMHKNVQAMLKKRIQLTMD